MSDGIEMEGNPDDLITSSEVAAIWNKRAKALGYRRKYTRRSVNYHCTYPKGNPALKPAQPTLLGNFFTRRQAWEFPISPGRGRKAPESGDESLD
jgi:hypothetical protein